MAYKTYKVLENNAINPRSSTDGYQPKFVVDSRKKFIKVQCILGKTLRDDWRVEDIATRVCQQLGIYAVIQKPCRVDMVTPSGIVKKRLGVVSDNFEIEGSFVSFARLLNTTKIPFDRDLYNKSSNRDKLGMLIKSTRNASCLSLEETVRYFYDMVTVDMLVLNQDRHFKNFGVFYNSISGRYEVSRLFDFGTGLFENDNMFDDIYSLNDCLRYSYISPYGEDPFILLKDLSSINSYKSYLRSSKLKYLNIPKGIFPSEVAYEYFIKMRREMLRV